MWKSKFPWNSLSLTAFQFHSQIINCCELAHSVRYNWIWFRFQWATRSRTEFVASQNALKFTGKWLLILEFSDLILLLSHKLTIVDATHDGRRVEAAIKLIIFHDTDHFIYNFYLTYEGILRSKTELPHRQWDENLIRKNWIFGSLHSEARRNSA